MALVVGGPRHLAPSRRRVPPGWWLTGLVGVGLLLAGPLAPAAQASSPEAWRAYDRQVRAACLAISRLLQPRALGERIDVPVAEASPDGTTALISALLLEGRYPQPHMGGQKGRELCLFDQRTRRATVAEADVLDRPRSKP